MTATKSLNAADAAPRSNLQAIGGAIRRTRTALGMTVEQLAAASGLSKGMVSKIENFRSIPSLPVLDRIAGALRTSLAALTEGVTAEPTRPYVLTRADAGIHVPREDAVGFFYQALNSANLGGAWLETYVLDLEPGARRAAVTTDGHQCVHLLAGRIDFVLDEERIDLQVGDTLLFNGRIPHVPINTGAGNARLFVMYLLDNNRGALA